MEKSKDAFRTISEVAAWLDVPTHVLRFWESRFTQVKPVKRAGGRRYYRPADMELLGGIKTLLHDDGLTIRGVQKLLREQGVRHVAAKSPPLDSAQGEDMRTVAAAEPADTIEVAPERPLPPAEPPAAAQEPVPETAPETVSEVAPDTAPPAPPETHEERGPGGTRAEAAPDAGPAEDAEIAPPAPADRPAAAPLGAHLPPDPADDARLRPDLPVPALARALSAHRLTALSGRLRPEMERLLALRSRMIPDHPDAAGK